MKVDLAAWLPFAGIDHGCHGLSEEKEHNYKSNCGGHGKEHEQNSQGLKINKFEHDVISLALVAYSRDRGFIAERRLIGSTCLRPAEPQRVYNGADIFAAQQQGG